MTLTSSSATIGLQSRLLQTNTNVFGQIQIGVSNQSITFDDSNVIYSLQAFMPMGGGAEFSVNPLTGVATSAAAFIAGQAQVETATAVGTCTTAGNVSVTINRGGQSSQTLISITGALTAPNGDPITFPDLAYDGELNGNPSYRSGNAVCYRPSASDAWVIYYDDTNPTYAAWYSFENVASPELVEYWNPGTTEGGTPVVTLFDGENIVVSVPIALNDTAAIWAGKVRTALAGTPAVSALFSVSGSSTAIVLTRKPLQILQGANMSVACFAMNDSGLNIGIAAGSTGVTSAATSSNTTAGVETSGCLVLDGDGKDIEGNTIGTLTRIDAALFKVVGGGVLFRDNELGFLMGRLEDDGQCLLITPNINSPIEFYNNAPTSVQVTILGKV